MDYQSVWDKSCDDVGKFSFNRRDCIVDADDTLSGQLMFTSLPHEYDFVKEYDFAVTETGQNFWSLAIADQIEVLPGDMIGWYNSNSGKIAYVTADTTVDGSEILPTTSGYGNRLSSGYYFSSSGSSLHNFKHAFRAHVVRPSPLHVYHNYTFGSARRDVQINVSNSFEDNVTDTFRVKVMVAVVNVSFEATDLGKHKW